MSGNVRNKIKSQPLSQKWADALEVLAAGGSIVDAARGATVDERTVRRWLEDEEFKGALAEVSGEAVRRCSRRLGRLADKGLSVLESVLDDPKAAPSVRVRAAQTVLDGALRWQQAIDWNARITALEQLAEGRK